MTSAARCPTPANDTVPTGHDLADDLLKGADAIADFLGCDDRQQVYTLRRSKKWPIINAPGVGLMARKSTLLAHIGRLEQEAMTNGVDSEENVDT